MRNRLPSPAVSPLISLAVRTSVTAIRKTSSSMSTKDARSGGAGTSPSSRNRKGFGRITLPLPGRRALGMPQSSSTDRVLAGMRKWKV